ncbi:MAG: aldo/keto reductase [Planctomycetota bacterium]
MRQTTRREFIQAAAASLAAAQLGSTVLAAQQDDPAGLPTRPLGKTGERVSIIALGGWDIGVPKDDELSISIMHEAIDEGMTFFDNCWDYHDGYSEEIMGKALATGGRRDKVFLMTKVCGRDYKSAKKQLEDSLRRLQTDHLDLWQFHGTKYPDDAELVFADDGAMKAALEAREKGKVRFIGFTGHQNPKFHQNFLDRDFEWDAVQMPLNVLDAHFRSFQDSILPQCKERNIGAIGMKALAAQDGRIVRDLGVSAETARRYSLSLPISALVCGIQSRENLRQDLAIARNFKPMTEQEVGEQLAQSKPFAAEGKIEAYKTGNYGCDWHHKERPA